jgi:hypothetical protein
MFIAIAMLILFCFIFGLGCFATEMYKTGVACLAILLLLGSTLFIPVTVTPHPNKVLQDNWNGIKFEKVMEIDYNTYSTDAWWSYDYLNQTKHRDIVVKEYNP